MFTLCWRRLPCAISELRLDISLACGQSFRWRERAPGEWTSVLAGYVWTIKQTKVDLLYRVHNDNQTVCDTKVNTPPQSTSHNKRRVESGEGAIGKKSRKTDDTLTTDMKLEHPEFLVDNNSPLYESILKDYFQLEINLEELYDLWSKADVNFASVAATFTGVRMLRQDPVENLFSFICSSNNHISRISGMVERMCETYGDKIFTENEIDYYSFPTIEKLAGQDVEQTLRGLSFGYRAKYINQTATYIMKNHSVEWLYSLRDVPYEEAKSGLLQLCGVGAKVADCVCLMSLDKLGAIPVDTHVWQIASRNYMPKLRTAKSVTPTIYNEIGDHFRNLWGPYAGWAHSVLFSADLKKFQDKKPSPSDLPVKVVQNQKPILPDLKKHEELKHKTERKRTPRTKKSVGRKKKTR